MEISKWLTTVASIWIQSTCGGSYAFGIYSPILKSSQSYSQSTLDTVSVFKDIGANAGIISGLLYAAVSRRRFAGPWVVHAAGAIQCFAGYFFLWLAVTGRIDRPSVPVVCFFMFLAAHAQTFFNTANVVTSVVNFPDYSGTIVGIMKGFLGLGGAILIQVYQSLYSGKPSTFLLMLAVLPTSISIGLMLLVRVHHVHSKDDKRYLNGFSLISMLIATYLMFLIISNIIFTLPQWQRGLTLAILIILLLSPIHIVIKAHKDNLQDMSQMISTFKAPLLSDSLEKQPAELTMPNNTKDVYEVPPKASTSENIHEAEEELNLVQAMSSLNFWLLFVAMLCGMGSGLATINNISQIGESLGYTSRERSTLVALLSIWNFLGRFGAGYLSDIFMHRKGWARPLVMMLTLAIMTSGHIIIGLGFPGNVYVGSVLVGVCYGSQWSLMPTITSEIFGVLHMGTIFNTIAVASPVGSYILSVRVIGYLYDKKASEVGNSCRGAHCFMLSFFILASVSLFGSLVALTLFIKTRRIYARIIHGRVSQ